MITKDVTPTLHVWSLASNEKNIFDIVGQAFRGGSNFG